MKSASSGISVGPLHEFCGTRTAAMRSRAGSAKDTGRNNFLAAESFCLRRRLSAETRCFRIARPAMGGNDEMDLDQV